MSFQQDIHVKPQRDHDGRAPTSIMTRSVSHLLTYNPDFKERIVHTAAPETYFLVTDVPRRTRLMESEQTCPMFSL